MADSFIDATSRPGYYGKLVTASYWDSLNRVLAPDAFDKTKFVKWNETQAIYNAPDLARYSTNEYAVWKWLLISQIWSMAMGYVPDGVESTGQVNGEGVIPVKGVVA